MSDASSILSLPYIQPSQAQKHVTHNEALRVLDALVQLSAKSRAISAPVASPQTGDSYIVGAAPSGAWAGHAGEIAVWVDSGWQFHTPLTGWRAWIEDEAQLAVFDGTNWVSNAPDFQNLAGLGVNSSYDGTNRLSVASAASLLNHDGAGHQLKINKNTAADTASLLYQSGFSGRAEMGLAGNDNFDIKVSADGATWQSAMTIQSDGNIGLGVPAPTETLEVNGNVLADAHLTPSDRRLKVNFGPAEPTGGLVDAIKVVSFDWISGGHTQFGLVAQDLFEVLPEAVKTGDDSANPENLWAVDYASLVPLLLKEVQELRQRVSRLETPA